jgi:signal transduction histidine kinase
VGISATETLNVRGWSDVTAREAANRERDALLERTEIVADEALSTAGEFVEVQLRTKGVRFIHVPCPTDVVFRADPEKVQQILLNLLSNAVKFTEPGGSVTMSCEHDENAVHLRVSDTGPGIPADKIERIFDPFVQVDQRFTREHKGVGLGLAISRELARG